MSRAGSFTFRFQKGYIFIKKFKYYSFFKAKSLNYSMFDSNWKNTEFNFY